ncbi:ABC transporter permease [Furfurilactobacillus rossiae]|uniref:Efflux ABC transporter, permease protein n=1 Tax=Furfurilactobacillus rossiae DSM 15814 TaxID=1114972 RepID=A0A0R1RJ94_9LACO|nr:ABC transporter permease [Furfurilactobacillus rossiae]KRL54386.1 efflux ABC transporter, permease protein [Furfurilactobacillus rossiae DSM 15814]QLE62382.1 ABC transporter permease protein [Furfurilactobacillus rossiae]
MKLLNRNIRREFKLSMARFISITILITLGVFILVGLKATGPDMKVTGQRYFSQHHLADAEVTSTTNLTQSDAKYLRTLPHVKKVILGQQVDLRLNDNGQRVTRVMALPKTLSTVSLTSGHLPTADNTVALSNKLKNRYHIGQWITLTANSDRKSSQLKHRLFKVVGFVNSANYIKENDLGNANVGNGQLTGFAVVAHSAFATNNYQVARIKFNNTHGAAYSDRYEKQTNRNVNQLQKELNHHARNRRTRLTNSAQEKINQQSQKLQTLQQQLSTQQAALKQTTQDTASTSQAQQQLQRQEALLAKKVAKLSSAKQQLRQINSLKYTIQSRNDYNTGYNEYGERANRISILSNTFPIIFFAIAVLVCTTTMGRMAEEKRIEMGTFRALGFSKQNVMKEFAVYGVSAAVVGSTLGAILGIILLPHIIFRAYTAGINVGTLQLHVPWLWLSISVVIALLCTTLPALWKGYQLLKEIPATLMLPKPPANGSRILLERITWLWRRLPFSQKVTFRNLFRYKERMLMTILGVFGCVMLLITGFGIRDSLQDLEHIQYSQIIHYDALGVYNSQDSDHNVHQYQQTVTQSKSVKRSMLVHYQSMYAKNSATLDNQSITMIVPKSTNHFSKFVTLRNRQSGKKITLNNNGVVISEKLANLFNKKVGDHLTIKDAQGHRTSVKISGITEMYIGHSLYMTSTYYKKVFNKTATANTEMIQLHHHNAANVNRLSRKLTKQSASLSVVQSLTNKRIISGILGGLNNVVLVIIICASLLAFVVLYTLTNINVSERIRELATIKVLGFYPFETTMYIYRETILLTIAGILFGFLGGDWLHRYIIAALPPETAMGVPSILASNLGVSTLLTVIFSLIVMGLMARKINRVDMLGALKSVD